MKLSKFFAMMFMLTVGSIIYIQLQFQIFDLAYQGRRREMAMQKLIDENSNAMYNIYRLKSANNLGIKLLSDNSKMQFLDGDHIVRLETPMPLVDKVALASSVPAGKKSSFLASVFSLKSQAEAESIR